MRASLPLLALLLATPASAQITITAADLTAPLGDTLTTTASVYTAQDPENATTIVAATGGGATYDFTVLQYEAPYVGEGRHVTLENTGDLPGTEVDVLADAEYVIVQIGGPGYAYYSLGDEGFFNHGSYHRLNDFDFDGVADEVYLYHEPPLLEFALPMTAGTAWEHTVTQVAHSDLSSAGPVTVRQDYTKAVEVEGWGTLVTPERSASALRLRTQFIVTLEGETETTTLIEFMTKEGLSANVWLDEAGHPHTATYTFSEMDGGTGQNQPPVAASIISPVDGASLVMGGAEGEMLPDPDTPFIVEWTAASDPDGDALTYRWQLTLSRDFSNLLLDAPSAEGGTATRYETNFGTLAALLDANSIERGGMLTLYHRVVTSDGMNDVTSTPFTLVLTRGTFVSTEDEPGLPSPFILHTNYPNPFNPTTTFSFDLPEPAEVRLTIYDLAGREIATVISGWLPAGTFQYAWEAGSLPSGVYLYRLQAGDRTETKKLIVQK